MQSYLFGHVEKVCCEELSGYSALADRFDVSDEHVLFDSSDRGAAPVDAILNIQDHIGAGTSTGIEAGRTWGLAAELI